MLCLNIGTPKNHHFSFGTNGKVVVLDVPILKHFRVVCKQYSVLARKFHEQANVLKVCFLNVTSKQKVRNRR